MKPGDLVRTLASGNFVTRNGGRFPSNYRLDMRNAGSYFLARQFGVRDKDIVYVANARLNEVQKFLSLLGRRWTGGNDGRDRGRDIHLGTSLIGRFDRTERIDQFAKRRA